MQLREGLSEAVETKNRIRNIIDTFFEDKDCFTLIRPITQEKELINLETTPVDKLRPKFI